MGQVFIHPGRGKVALTSIVADFQRRELRVEVEGNAKNYAKSSGFLHGLSKYLESLGLDVLGAYEGEELRWSASPLNSNTLVFDVSGKFLNTWYSRVRRYDLLNTTKMAAKARLMSFND
jgi:hypothetical protein